MSEWKIYRLGDICKNVCSGGTPKSTEPLYYGGDIPWLNTKEVDFCRIAKTEKTITDSGFQNSSTKWIDKNSVIVAMYGATAAKVAVNTIPLTTNQACCNLMIDPNLADFRFVYFYLCYKYTSLAALANGGAQQNLNTQRIKDFEITLPLLKEQKCIADILWALDDKIELNRRINANLEEQAQALFKSWFVDFEPFRDGPFIDSELGKIPKGWKVGTINEIIQILSGFAFKSGTFSEDGPYQLITIKNVQDGNLNVNGAVHISEIPDRMPLHCKLYIGDILLSLTGNVGRVSIVDQDSLLLNQRVAKLRPKDKRNTFFTYTLFRQDNFKQYLIQIAKGTAQLNLSPIEIGETKIILPNHDLLSQFGEIGQPLFDRIVSNSREIITLSTLRDTLLPKLMAGEIAIE